MKKNKTVKGFNMKKNSVVNYKKALATALCVLCASSLFSCGDIEKQLGMATQPPETQVVTDAQGDTVIVEKGPYDGLFDSGKVININITMAPTDRTAMLASPETEEYYNADVTVDGVECKNVGFRTRGNVSYVSTTEGDRFSYKINFGKYTDGTLNGLDELCLNNMAYDPSYIREYLTYTALEELGAPSPLSTFANVTVNGEFAGLYLAVESVDDSFLNRIYGNSDGTLYKAGRGSTLVGADTSTFEVKNGDDVSMSQLRRMVSAMSDVTQLASCLDISGVLKYTAVNAVIANEDSYLGEKARNYYFYSQNGKLSMIPWDFNLAFGTDTSHRKDEYAIKTELVNADFKNPYFGALPEERPLVASILANEDYFAEYKQYVEKLTEFLEKLPEKVQPVKELIASHVKNDAKAFYAYELFENEFDANAENSMMGFVKKRAEALRTQLEGN